MTLVREWQDAAGMRRSVLVRPLPAGLRAISTAVIGGGIGPCGWWLNAQVDRDYDHPDPTAHAAELAASFGLGGPGVAMLTAADVRHLATASVEGVEVIATVGLGLPVFAAASADDVAREGVSAARRAPRPGTINVLAVLPVALGDAALVNAVVTATEAKTQALAEAGVPGTGTSSDALCIACPDAGEPEEYGGPRSVWGARLARAVHAAVAEGTGGWLRLHPPGDAHRRWVGADPLG